MNKLDEIFAQQKNIKDFSKSYLDYLCTVLNKISLDDIEKFIETLLVAREKGSMIYFIGNGGSAATAAPCCCCQEHLLLGGGAKHSVRFP